MKAADLVKELSLEVKSCEKGLHKDVTGAYISDLLSDVMANSKEGNVWITLQTHINIVAVASMKSLNGIIIVGGRNPQNETINKAETENITIMTTPLPAFEVAGRIYQMLNQ